jgi:hypothetical protein
VNGPENLWSRWSNVSRCLRSFDLIFCVKKKMILGRILGSDALRRRMALRTHYLRSGYLKMRLWWSWWSDVWRWRKIMLTHFQQPGIPEKRIGPCRGSDVSSRRMAQWNHNLPSGSLKMRLWRSGWNNVSRCLRAYQLIFRIQGIKISDLDEIAEVMF